MQRLLIEEKRLALDAAEISHWLGLAGQCTASVQILRWFPKESIKNRTLHGKLCLKGRPEQYIYMATEHMHHPAVK